MSSQFSALSAGPSAGPSSSKLPQHTRRRRASISGKFLGLFSAKSKPESDAAPHEESRRPIISFPHPLERRIPPPHKPAPAHGRPVARRKRDYAETSSDENVDVTCLERSDDETSSRATRPRLTSDSSSHTIRSSSPLKAGHQTPSTALKSALKKPAQERTTTDTKEPLSARLVHGHARAKAALKAITVHNRALRPSSFNRGYPLQSTTDNGPTNEAISSLELPAASPLYSSAPHADAHPSVRTKKTVTFADDTDTMVGLKRSRTFRNIPKEVDHWADVAMDIGTDAMNVDTDTMEFAGSTFVPSTISFSDLDEESSTTASSHHPPSRLGHKSEPQAPVFSRASPLHARMSKHPLPPRSSDIAFPKTTSEWPEESRGDHESFRTVLARQVPPTPEAALKRDPFLLPIMGGAQRASSKGTDAEEKENRFGASTLLKEVLQDIAREKEDRQRERGRERGRAATKPALERPMSILKRFTVDIVPTSRHTTIWDGSDSDVYTWSGTLEVRDTKPASYFYPRHAIQELSIRFHTVSEPREDPATFDPGSQSSSSPVYEWQTSYTDLRIRVPCEPAAEDFMPTLNPTRGIAVAYSPVLKASDNPDGPCTWLVRFWVPIPLHLFARAEHRTFVCRAKVTVRDWETPKTVIPGGCIAVGMERLRTGRLLSGLSEASAGTSAGALRSVL
ncbi:hypothetical protein BC628DRAFT_1416635 [Trametes gibbosa]|nr:hypothetical protein BC628DRAFT_1416635 [Trametes gibbosa]